MIIGSEPVKTDKTRLRSERVEKRKAFLVNEGVTRKIKKDVANKIEQKRSLKGESKASEAPRSEAANKKSIEAPLEERIDEPPEVVSKTPSVASSTQPTALKLVEEPLKQLTNVEPSIESTSKNSIAVPVNEQVNESSQIKRGRKTKVINYEIDCSGINMDTTNFVIFLFLLNKKLTNESLHLEKRLVESS